MDEDFDDFIDDDDDDDDDDYIRSEFEQWVDDYTGNLYRNREKYEMYPDTDLYPYFHNVYKPAKNDIQRISKELLFKLFPETRDILYPKVWDEINYWLDRIGILLLLDFFNLKMHIQYKDNLREVYENFDKMEKNFVEYQKSRPYWFDLMEKYPQVPQEVWDTIQKHYFDDDSYKFEEWEYIKTQKFTLPLQQIMIKYCPEIVDFSRDEWIVFYDMLQTEFLEFEFSVDKYASAAEHKFTEEETLLPYKEFMEVLGKKMDEEYNLEEKLGNEGKL